MTSLFQLSFAVLTALFFASCGGKNTPSNVEAPGGEKDAKSRTLEAGADLLQSKSPLRKINAYLDGFHFYNGNTQAYIESNLDQKISVENLSSRFLVGRRNFDRRFIKATGNTPVEYAQRVRIESAKKAFETSRKTINEVMYEVGYSDVKAFREVFRKITGISPLEYRSRYNKEAAI